MTRFTSRLDDFVSYTASLIMFQFSRILQSDTEFLFDESLTIEVTKLRSNVGYGRKYNLQGLTIERYAAAHNNRSVDFIEPLAGKETLCLAYALVLGIAHCQGNKNHFNYLTYPGNIDSFTEEALV